MEFYGRRGLGVSYAVCEETGHAVRHGGGGKVMKLIERGGAEGTGRGIYLSARGGWDLREWAGIRAQLQGGRCKGDGGKKIDSGKWIKDLLSGAYGEVGIRGRSLYLMKGPLRAPESGGENKNRQ